MATGLFFLFFYFAVVGIVLLSPHTLTVICMLAISGIQLLKDRFYICAFQIVTTVSILECDNGFLKNLVSL